MTEGDFVAIIGLGLIGGSIARDLAERGIRVLAYDCDRDSLRSATDEGVVERPLCDDFAGVCDASAVVIALPVDAAVDALERLAPLVNRDAFITDVGSTKSRIVERAVQLGLAQNFVGAHPLAGDHRSGWTASRGGLFCGARVFLCPALETDAEIVNRAARFWSRLGAKPALLRADLHDVQLAYTSHLPQLVSVGLALALAKRGVMRADLGPGGRDMTRLAGSSPDMWTAIARENSEMLRDALLLAEHELADLRSALSRDDTPDLRERLSAARAWFEV